MTVTPPLQFDQPGLGPRLESLSDAELDTLDFGVIGFDATTTITRYNALESSLAGLSQSRVIGHPLFDVVAPCMNNFMVAQRFDDALGEAAALDTVIDYVLTLRMRPVKVKLRLLASPAMKLRYVLIKRPG